MTVRLTVTEAKATFLSILGAAAIAEASELAGPGHLVVRLAWMRVVTKGRKLRSHRHPRPVALW